MKNIVKIIASNWISLLVSILAVYVYAFITAYSDKAFGFKDAVFSATYLTFFYGLPFWLGFLLCILVLDTILFSVDKKLQNTSIKLFAEWIIISSPFVYWLIIYSERIFVVAVLAFLVGQYLRRTYIYKVLAM